jgi:hypothetical protein
MRRARQETGRRGRIRGGGDPRRRARRGGRELEADGIWWQIELSGRERQSDADDAR